MSNKLSSYKFFNDDIFSIWTTLLTKFGVVGLVYEMRLSWMGLSVVASQMGIVGWKHIKMDQKWLIKKSIISLLRCFNLKVWCFGNVKLSIWTYEVSGMPKP